MYRKRRRQAQCLPEKWLMDYLPALQRRQKWYLPRCNFVMGDLILVVDERAHGVIGQWVSSRTCTPTVTDMSEMCESEPLHLCANETSGGSVILKQI